MAAARWKLVQSFIREATEDANFAPVADIATAYAKLRTVQRGAFTIGTAESGLLQVASRIGETEFSFSVPDGMAPADIMAIAEEALQLIEGRTVAEARAMLTRRKTTGIDCRGLTL